MDKRSILNALKKDLESAKLLRINIDNKIKEWKDGYDGALYGNEEDGKSSIVSRDIKQQDDWQHANLISPFVSSPEIMKATPVTWEDVEPARQNEIVLNTQFCRQFKRYNFMSKAVKVLSREGTAIIQTGWDYEDEEIQKEVDVVVQDEYGNTFTTKKIVNDIKIIKNQPTAKVCRNQDTFIDPTCQDDMDECQFIITRYESDISTLKQDGRYKNLDKINKDNSGSDNDPDYIAEDETYFKFEDDPRKKLMVYEYWGNYDINNDGIAEPIVCVWVNDTIIRLSENPYPDKKPPFVVVAFNAIPFKMHGEANAELIGDKQKVKTAIIRGIIDNMTLSNNGQKGIKKGALDSRNREKFLNNKNFEFNTSPNDFWDGSYNQIPSSAFNLISLMDNQIEASTGVKGFNGGMSSNSLGNTATGVRGVLDAVSTRRLNIVRNISENLVKPLLRKWMVYNSEFLNDEQMFGLINEKPVAIKKSDLDGAIDIDIEVSTAEDNAARAQELAFMLQTLGPSSSADERRLLQIEIAYLQNMPGLAKKLEEYKPSEAEILSQKLEIENARLKNEKLKAEIEAIKNSGYEDLSDVREKDAQARLKNAQADKLIADAKLVGSKTDMEDLNFIRSEQDIDHINEMEKKEYDRKTNLQAMLLQAKEGDKNIGVYPR